MSGAKTDELIEMPFGIWTRVGPGNHMLDGVHIGATCATIEPSMCGSNAAFLSNYFDALYSSVGNTVENSDVFSII